MADEPQLVRGIDWKTTLPFTLIFRSFRIAIHPSKLVLALLALLLIYLGGSALDGIWPRAYRAVPLELDAYRQMRLQGRSDAEFVRERDSIVKETDAEFHQKLKDINVPNGDLSDIRKWIVTERDKQAKAIQDAYDKAKKDTPESRLDADTTRDQRLLAVYTEAADSWMHFKAVEGSGLFTTLAHYQFGTLTGIVSRARDAKWFGPDGVLDALLSWVSLGPVWAMRYHAVFFTIFFIYALIIWSVFGGAVARIAAVQVARDEKISFRQALSFSTSKFLSFVSAPIIPLLIVTAVGLVITVGALAIFNWPFLGPIVGGALFFLALAAGFVMTLVLIGLLGGFNLMYPTIAVEGSDSFDAISRSFSYFYARPWRLTFYTFVAAAYGTITYGFVRYFLRLMLALTHFFTGLGVFRTADNGQPLWPVIWPDPLLSQSLSYRPEWLTLSTGQSIGTFFLALWVYLTIAALGAFLISFYFSANTIIYVLMRHEVDATELDDVYLEQSDEEFAELSGAPPTIESATADAPPNAPPTPLVDPPPQQG